MVHYNTGLGYNTDQCWTPNDYLGLIFIFNYTFLSSYNTVGLKIGLDPNNSYLEVVVYFGYGKLSTRFDSFRHEFNLHFVA